MTCPWDPDDPTIEEELELGIIDLTRYLRSHTMTPYRNRLKAGEYNDAKKAEAAAPKPTPTRKSSTRPKKKT